MALNCGHVFCQFCIKQWEWRVKTKKDFTCPNCRVLITSQSQSKHIENLISALYRDIDETLSKEREDLIQERKLEMEKAVKPDPKKAKKGQNNVRQWVQVTTAAAIATTSGTRNTIAQIPVVPQRPPVRPQGPIAPQIPVITPRPVEPQRASGPQRVIEAQRPPEPHRPTIPPRPVGPQRVIEAQRASGPQRVIEAQRPPEPHRPTIPPRPIGPQRVIEAQRPPVPRAQVVFARPGGPSDPQGTLPGTRPPLVDLTNTQRPSGSQRSVGPRPVGPLALVGGPQRPSGPPGQARPQGQVGPQSTTAVVINSQGSENCLLA